MSAVLVLLSFVVQAVMHTFQHNIVLHVQGIANAASGRHCISYYVERVVSLFDNIRLQ